MRKLIKGAALALATVMAVSSAQLVVMAADPNFQPEHEDTATTPALKEFEGAAPLSAQVEELKGDELDVTLSTVWGDNGAMVGGTYTLNKAARFSTTYKRDANGNIAEEDKAKAADELANYGGWVCDYRITVDSENGSINGDDVYLYGSYGGYQDIAFKCSQLAETIPDGTYEIMAWTGLDSILTYKDVVNSVKTFTCGLIDNGLAPYVKISVQLVVYDGRDRTAAETKCYYVGEPVVYEKKKSEAAGEELIPVGDIDSTVKEVAAEGVENLTVEGIKDAMIATEKTKLINDYIVENNITAPTSADTTMVDVDIYAQTEALAENKFELTPHARITSDGKPDKDIEISNDQLEEDAKIKIEVPSAKKPLYIMHRSEGYDPEKYTPGDPEEGMYFSYENKVCTFYVSHFSDIELITDPVMITDVDAYVDNDGTGNLRFITTVYGDDAIEEFGTWVVPADYLSNDKWAVYSNSTDTVGDGSTFTADIMQIPLDMLGTMFHAKSYVKVNGENAWSDVKAYNVNGNKNSTSK